MSSRQQCQAVFSPGGRYRADARGNLIAITDLQRGQSWMYAGHLEGIYQLQGEILALHWESEEIICSESSTGATHRWLATSAIHLSTPAIAFRLRVPHKGMTYDWIS